MKVLVTGANGFVGRALCAELLRHGHAVRGAVRRHDCTTSLDPHVEGVAVGSIGASTKWTAALTGCDAVVHLAARVHVMRDQASDPVTLFREVNTEGTLNLARQAASGGVKRFIFVSSIKVNGEGSDSAYREIDPPDPKDAYAVSKWEAEQGLIAIASETRMEVVILRPPLVYGPGVKANFLQLIEALRRGWPLPLSSMHNRRSLLYLGNLVDAIRLCLKHPAAAGQIFMVDDGAPVSTPELVRAMADAMGRPAWLVPVPVVLLEILGRLLGRRQTISRLTDSLWVDSTAIRSCLGWTPPYSMAEGLAATVNSEA
jgi:nucleoside-diphosphate-sugar epimerase